MTTATNRKFNWVKRAARLLGVATMGDLTGQYELRTIPCQPLRRLLLLEAPGNTPSSERNNVRRLLQRCAKEGGCSVRPIRFLPGVVEAVVHLKTRNVPVLLQERS